MKNWKRKYVCQANKCKIYGMQNISNISNDVDYYVAIDCDGSFIHKSIFLNEVIAKTKHHNSI